MRNVLPLYFHAGRPRLPVRKRRPAYMSLRYMRPRPPFTRLYDMMWTEREMREMAGVLVIRRRPEPRP